MNKKQFKESYVVFLLIIFIGLSVFNTVCCGIQSDRIKEFKNKQYDYVHEIIGLQTERDILQEKLDNTTDFEQFMTDYSEINTNELLVIDESQLTEDLLLNRNGKLIISKCVGKVVSEGKDGCIINKAADKDYDYISYKCVKDCKIDDIIVTYLIYNPDNNYTDDIISRFDYIVSRNKTEN